MDTPGDSEADMMARFPMPPTLEPSGHENTLIERSGSEVDDTHEDDKTRGDDKTHEDGNIHGDDDAQAEEGGIASDSTESDSTNSKLSSSYWIHLYESIGSPPDALVMTAPTNVEPCSVAAIVEAMKNSNKHGSDDHNGAIKKLNEMSELLATYVRTAQAKDTQDATSDLELLEAILDNLGTVAQQLQQQKMGDQLRMMDEKLDRLGQKVQEKAFTNGERLDLVIADVVDLEQRVKAVESMPLKDGIESINTNVATLLETITTKLSDVETKFNIPELTQAINENGKRTHESSVANTPDQLEPQLQSSMNQQLAAIRQDLHAQSEEIHERTEYLRKTLVLTGTNLRDSIRGTDKKVMSLFTRLDDEFHKRVEAESQKGASVEEQSKNIAVIKESVGSIDETLAELGTVAGEMLDGLGDAEYSRKSAHEDTITRLKTLDQNVDDIAKLVTEKTGDLTKAQNELGECVMATCQVLEHRLVPFIEDVATKHDLKGLTDRMANLETSLKNTASDKDAQNMRLLESYSAIKTAVDDLTAKVSGPAATINKLATELQEIKHTVIKGSNVANTAIRIENDVKHMLDTVNLQFELNPRLGVVESISTTVTDMNKRMMDIEKQMKCINDTIAAPPAQVAKDTGITKEEMQALFNPNIGRMIVNADVVKAKFYKLEEMFKVVCEALRRRGDEDKERSGPVRAATYERQEATREVMKGGVVKDDLVLCSFVFVFGLWVAYTLLLHAAK